jgi:hypothetical protein
MSQRLIIEDDEGTTTIVPLGKDAVTIGRQQGNTIQLTEKNVSRRHARLYPELAAWVIEDLGSYNGVKVNGVPIDGRVNLKEGDVVQIGDYHLALTEDVDKRTLNYPNAGAANDGAVAEPMLASSSTDLPRLSAEELAALQSGPHPAAQPALLDSGPVPATPMPLGYEERKKGGAGVLIGLGVVVVLGLVGGAAWMASERGGDSDKKVASAEKTNENPPQKAVNADSQDADAKAVEPPQPTPPTPPPPEAEVADDGGDPPEPLPEQPEPEPELTVDDPPPDPITSPNPAKKSKSRNKKNNGSSKKDPVEATAPTSKPPKPPPPSVDPNELLKEARKVGLTNPRNGYDLSAQALKAGGGRAAAKLMATMACRIPDGAKAKKALARLKGADREAVAKICRAKGIDV